MTSLEAGCGDFSPNPSTLMFDFFPWMRMTLFHDQMIKWTKQKCMSLQSCVWEEHVIHQTQTSSGKNGFRISNNPTSMQHCLEIKYIQIRSREELSSSMFNDTDWTKNCISNVKELSDCTEEFQRGHWSFLGLEDVEMVWNLQLARRKMGPKSRSND